MGFFDRFQKSKIITDEIAGDAYTKKEIGEMDEQKMRIVAMVKKHPDSLTSRNRMKALLEKYFPDDKLCVNLILYAFDEDIPGKLTASGQDVSLEALRVKKTLETDYGVTEGLAAWAVSTWCTMLGMNELADLITITQLKDNETAVAIPAVSAASAAPPPKSTKKQVVLTVTDEYIIGEGIHRAGVDFPAGDVSIQVREETIQFITYGISDNPMKLRDCEYEEFDFKNRTYLRIKPGDYLLLSPCEQDKKFTFSVRATGIA